MFFIAYTFKGQVQVFAGRVKIVSHSSCRTSTILKYFCPLHEILVLQAAITQTSLHICAESHEALLLKQEFSG